jgi:hypothetical protein
VRALRVPPAMTVVRSAFMVVAPAVGEADGGRAFHVMVAFGPQASGEVQRQAWAILDGLRVDPSVVPDWQSSG